MADAYRTLAATSRSARIAKRSEQSTQLVVISPKESYLPARYSGSFEVGHVDPASHPICSLIRPHLPFKSDLSAKSALFDTLIFRYFSTTYSNPKRSDVTQIEAQQGR